MPLRQLRNHVSSLSFGQSTLRPASATRLDAWIIFGLQWDTGARPAIVSQARRTGAPVSPGRKQRP
jgi:hypothetical protein